MKTFKIKNLLAIVLLSALTFSCSSDDSSNDSDTVEGSKYVLGYWTETWNANYLWSFDSLEQLMSGTIDMTGKGIEQGGSYVPIANTMFALDTEVTGAAPYYLNAASQLTAGNRIFIESSYAYGVTDDNKLLIIGASWDGTSTDNELIVYDPEKQAITARKFDNFQTTTGRFDFPTAVTVSGGKIYVSVFNRDKDWNMVQDKAYIRIYDYPSLNFVKRIEDPRTTAVGMYYTGTGVVRTDSGNVYTFSSNALSAGYETPEANKKSAILRINKGASEFDANYFFETESSSLGGKVIAAYPIGGEKAYVVYIPTAEDTALWGFLNHVSYKFKSAIIDLPSKTITKVTGLPDHAGDNYFGIGSLFVEDGKAYKAFKTNDEVRVYKIDLTTGAATKGALVTGGGVDIAAITKLAPKK
ncbi:hypothetical protein J2Y38_001325 [Flavobacterium sp. 2755]|uniref:DUF4374 domain-containing protein n=1 Tax=Flavobacterium sp. 2755 TaxID=2817765 RepID=UPI00285A6AED|nr:DUF4374 domain-containing protein [Flavobacterium sp. 2755]MDR6761127.1 hypothetical protein [Flavobacterium sp. 2755]